MRVGFVCFVHSFVRTRLSLKQGLKVRNAAHEVDLVVPDDIKDRGNDHNLEVPRHAVQYSPRHRIVADDAKGSNVQPDAP